MIRETSNLACAYVRTQRDRCKNISKYKKKVKSKMKMTTTTATSSSCTPPHAIKSIVVCFFFCPSHATVFYVPYNFWYSYFVPMYWCEYTIHYRIVLCVCCVVQMCEFAYMFWIYAKQLEEYTKDSKIVRRYICERRYILCSRRMNDDNKIHKQIRLRY